MEINRSSPKMPDFGPESLAGASMEEQNTESMSALILAAVAVSTAAYLWGGKLLSLGSLKLGSRFLNDSKSTGGGSNCIVRHMEENDRNCVVFFGSQTGNSQDMAEKLAREGQARFGLDTMLADLDEYDYEGLSDFPADKLAIFVMSSYGDGEPTDNAQRFYDFITDENCPFDADQNTALEKMRYAALGLGNSNYAHYNAVIRNVNKAMQAMGAQPLGPTGEIDDSLGDMEEEFLAWKEEMWAVVSQAMHLEEREVVFEPSCKVSETASTQLSSEASPHSASEVSIAPLSKTYGLFTNSQRDCVHIELDLKNTNLSYETGDHLGVYPSNPDIEVDRFLRAFGLQEKRDIVIDIQPTDGSKPTVPSPTTYDAVVRHHLEICGPVSRQLLSILAGFVTDERHKVTLTSLGRDKDAFFEATTHRYYNLAGFIEELFPENPVLPIPLEVLLDSVPKLRPRYYSISSSSLVQRGTLAITAVVECYPIPNTARFFHGVATNYLLDLALRLGGVGLETTTRRVSYSTPGLGPGSSPTLPVAVRKSNFRLANDLSHVIMIGCGTGVAPFRAFVQERAAMMQAGQAVGNMTLFYGCRKEAEDFLYRGEWKGYQEILGDKFKMHVAFSRQTEKKVYVQDLLEQEAQTIYQALRNNGHVYVCGDATMGRGVSKTLCNILSITSHMSLADSEAWLEDMRSSHKYQVFTSNLLHCRHTPF
ncbi:NADPH-ferrihemoprotein reductase [Tolypocladium paradoxum]|uniref:NADPH--cytochrome P450 reductase n=1 Tax=Tolypocladium paradoxum TaxID=94208 RepID=A0A2S4L6Z9_9HYPO|nr:NADPH-ferrihemoprotein reductase [Tolypocladium paradoxum]